MRMFQLTLILAVIGFGIASAQVKVAATIGVIADMVKSVGGNRVQLSQVVPGTSDPHSFEPKPSLIREIAGARVLFANGLGLEPFLEKLQAQLPKGARVVELAEGMPKLIKAEEHAHGGYDPHLWLDPTYGVRYVEKIRDTLSQLDPAGKTTYAANASRYIAEIKKADAEVLACLEPIPPSRRKLVSQHEALGYFLRHYQITSVGSIADFAGQERGPQRFARLAQEMKKQGVKVVFAEPQFPQAEARALAEATGARVRLIYSDAFDANVNTYLKLIRANGKAVCEAFR
ncbi:metal ABC transporter substrate-binding protein [Calidithermus roseus]|uniref:Manganese-binding lipoprotein MntA n=1 Tax=Calidithermus roseus TaxID=1644118 RepID=A0A399EJT8_9DEIN|nr:metal ABC transporter substrate-binding protein [Calidithermus roseus]RIH82612.1 Manganese-binding lipoprotein MntA [Calidithermus roseus]